jgi:tetratricopeptide (TPR) repeat protein
VAAEIAPGPASASEVLPRIEQALRLEPGNARLLLQRAHCLLALGQVPAARAAAAAAQEKAPPDPVFFDAIGTLFSRANDQRRALVAYDRAVALAPDDPYLLYNRATVCRFLGALDAAERDYDRVIALRPHDYEAYRNRAELRTQSKDRNHTSELEALVETRAAGWRGEVELRYALAKEYEDLGEHARSFHHLQRGARLRRDHLRYDVATDEATVDWIIDAFPDPPAAPTRDASDASPIFIVGLPRSGTTLVDRILGSHSEVLSAGELPQLSLAIVAAGQRGSAAPPPRRELIARSARLDFAHLGRDYLARVHAAGVDAVRFTDKMPLNHLYCGLIRRALPAARIVHVTREPMAACYAIYKTLFTDGYPFSYDLGEIGRYYVAYRRLMRHWEATLPGAIHTVSYEELVSDQLGETRRLLEFCGLQWQSACLEFHRNPAATTTASAAQVRQPMHTRSIAQWRHYETQLTPLLEQLRAAGLITDA